MGAQKSNVISAPYDPISSFGASSPSSSASASCSRDMISSVIATPTHVIAACDHGIPLPQRGGVAPIAPRNFERYASTAARHGADAPSPAASAVPSSSASLSHALPSSAPAVAASTSLVTARLRCSRARNLVTASSRKLATSTATTAFRLASRNATFAGASSAAGGAREPSVYLARGDSLE